MDTCRHMETKAAKARKERERFPEKRAEEKRCGGMMQAKAQKHSKGNLGAQMRQLRSVLALAPLTICHCRHLQVSISDKEK